MTNGGTTCHVLPCGMDLDLMAPIGRYFHPTSIHSILGRGAGNEHGRTLEEGGKEEDAVVLAAQFCGRGLLCIADSKKTMTTTTTTPLSELPPDMMGVVFSSSLSSAPSSSFSAGKNTMTNKTVSLRPIETFRSLHFWTHEHDPRKVMGDRLSGHGDDRIGLSAALSWRDLAREIHDPIPI